MNIDTINAIVAFLQRVELKGSEVPAFNKIMGDLQVEKSKAEVEENTGEKND